VYASRDLIKWTQIGNVVTRDSQLDMSGYHVNVRGESGGVWAPTIRYHDGLFYVNVTCVNMTDDMNWDEDSRFHSFIWTCSDPFTEEWSDAVRFQYPGFDTSLFWDTDGRSYVQGSQSGKSFDKRQISQYEIDLKTGESLSGPPKPLWDGTGGIFTEAPHIFFKDGYYYLLVAEGGTYMGHSALVARSKDLWGPYESAPSNPVLKPPAADEYVQTIGHADFVQDEAGNWWAVALGTRIEKDNASPMGRETYLIEGVWPEGDWPSFTLPVKINSSSDRLPPSKSLDKAAAFQHEGSLSAFSTEASPSKFSPHWIFVRNPVVANYKITSPTTLTLKSSDVTLSDKKGSPSFVGQRQTAIRFHASVVLQPSEEKGVEAGFTVFLDAIRHAEIFVKDGKVGYRSTIMGALGVSSDVALLSLKEPKVELEEGSAVLAGSKVKFLVNTSDNNEFVYSYDAGEGVKELGRVKAIELSVGFTGEYLNTFTAHFGIRIVADALRRNDRWRLCHRGGWFSKLLRLRICQRIKNCTTTTCEALLEKYTSDLHTYINNLHYYPHQTKDLAA
jgi:xylan 1,4-beta-xylosidase